MLQIQLKDIEFFDEEKEEFFTVNKTIVLEHSLLSISKWEAQHKTSFFTDKKTIDEFLDYIKCMTITSKVDPVVYQCLNAKHLKQIQDYIDDPMTATTFKSSEGRSYSRRRGMTSELIYCWMFSFNIPLECERWHFNKLMTLIRVCGIENNPNKKKMSRREIYNQNAALNAARRAKYNTRG